MSSAETPSRRRSRGLRLLVASVLVATGALTVAEPASADEVYPRPVGSSVVFKGHGWGHGIGLSQYGTLGGAKAGATWQEILAHYYQGTARTASGNPTIRVRVASLGSAVEAYPASGLRVTWDLASSSVLPTSRSGKTIARWRIVPAAKKAGTQTRFRLEYLPTGSSTWASYATASVPLTGAFLNPTSGTVTTRRGSTTVIYRGQVRGTLIGSAGAESLVPVVALPMEDYLRSVVPNESPASWPAAALSAQAVAARSYAEYHRRYAPSSSAWYDVWDDTRSQVFPGTKVGSSTKEYATSDAAVRATAGTVLTYSGRVALTMFSSSNGGYSASGGQPYLTPVKDTWDAVSDNPNHTWTTTVPISRIESAYPSVGRLSALRITSRTGLGAEGGRVLGITVQGSSGSVSTTGLSFAAKVGLKHYWFTPTNSGSAPSYPRDVTSDGVADVLAVEAGTGTLRTYPTTGTGGWRAPVKYGTGFDGYAKILTAGTWDGDAISDLVVQTTPGNLYFRKGRGDGTFASSVKIGAGWQVHDLVMPVGDFDGDHLTDLIARSRTGGLFLYRGNGQGRFLSGSSVHIGSGWDIFSDVLSPGDVTGDGFSDVLAVTTGGTAYLYPGNGRGGWILPRRTVGTGWNAYTALTSTGDFTGEGKNDVLARTGDGLLMVLPGSGTGTFGAPVQVGKGWNIFSTILR
jgi:SpoIID/LytB domain protein